MRKSIVKLKFALVVNYKNSIQIMSHFAVLITSLTLGFIKIKNE